MAALNGPELLEEIRRENGDGRTVLWWLGQSGYAIKSGNTFIYIDLYLSERLTEKYRDAPNPHIRITPAPFKGNQIEKADYFISTHKHTDHMDFLTLLPALKNCPNAKYILPKAHVPYALENGFPKERLIAAKAESPISCGDITVIPLPASHESLDYSEESGYPHMSYIIKTQNHTLFHSGDTVPYNGLIEYLKKYRVQTALLPVNGRDKRRHSYGTPGNCTGQEALCICRLAGINSMIPHHYDMFTFNTIDIEEFREMAHELYPDITCHILACGEKMVF